MAVPLRVLILEDEPADAELAVHALRQAGFEPDWTRVDTEEDYVRCLELSPNVILADHRLPQFDSVRALARLRERGLDVPFVIVSGAIAQDLAVGLMEQGAADFVVKDRLARLGPAVLRALERKLLRDEKRLAEQRLLASERRFRALIEHSSDGIVLLSPEAVILYASRSTARILGYVPEELAGRNAFDFVHPEDIASTRTQIEDLKQSPGIVVSAMFRMAHKDGSWRWVEMTGTNLLAEPDVQAIVINLRDVTERERARRELQEQTQLLQNILESMSEGVIVADRNERFRIFNAAAQRIYGQGAAEAPSSEWPQIYHLYLPDGVTPFPADRLPLVRAIRGESTAETEILVRRSQAADSLVILVSGRPIRGGTGDVVGGVIVCHDVTARRQAAKALAQRAEELARSNRELQQLAYVAAHDLQEPLRMVASYVELVAERYKGRLDEKADKYINYAVEGADRMKALVDALRGFLVLTTQARPFEPVDAAASILGALANLHQVIEEREAVVTHDPLPSIKGDPAQMVQLFQNLIGNALKFCDGTPRVHVAAERTGEEWVFSVRDNGIGIAPEHHERIFQIFQRLHGRDKYPGTGMGLAICKKVVERHGGRIWVESRPGQGSTFFFTLPVVGRKLS